MPSGPHVRVDTYLQAGSVLSPYYDSLMAKIIVHTPTREMGLAVMLRALDEVVIEGVKTNIEEQKLLIQSRPFSSGRFSTDLYAKVVAQEKHHG
jgi:acetyl-CoA carboxylase biotin carboxylase subunit